MFIENRTKPDQPVLRKKKFKFNKTNRSVDLTIPFSINDVFDYKKGWLTDSCVRCDFCLVYDNLDVTCLYPIRLKNSTNNGLYGIKYFIPLSLFAQSGINSSPVDIENQICINPIYTNSLSVTPTILFSKEQEIIDLDDFILRAQTSLQFNYYQKDVIFDILVTFVNKDKTKNFSSFFAGVSQSSINLPDFTLNKPIREEGFAHIYDSKEVIEMDVKIRIYNDNYDELQKKEEREIVLNLCKDYYHNSCIHYIYLAAIDNFDNNNKSDEEPFNDAEEQNNNSKMETGYVGLSNQGATCYLNSFMQTLFHLPAFRRLIYDMPTTGNEDPHTSIPLNIQRLFCQLQFSDKPCSTVGLTKSFGWDSEDAFQQHDIEEFSRVLIDNLEKKMKGTNLQDSIPHIFRGRFRNYIKCLNVDYTSFKEETFYDLSMDVKGILNLSEAFKFYIKPDELIGDNQYNTEKFGKQDAMKGTEFLEFPPVLHIHLRRFIFDVTSLTGTVKINDHFEFPETIDLTEFLAADSPQKKLSNIYDLYGVIVHSGSYSGGHYYAFLRTSTDPQWYKFNDSFVSKETVENAVYNNFGGNGRSYSGYMLIYVQREKAKTLFEPINNDSVPKHLKTFEEKIHKKEKNIKVFFVHECSLKLNVADKILRFFRNNEVENKNNLSRYDMHMEEYDRSTTISELYALLGSLYAYDESQFRLWMCFCQKVPRRVISYSDAMTIDEITKGRNKLYVFVQPIKDDDHFDFRNQIMIYINFFFTENLLKGQAFKEDNELLKKQLAAPLQYFQSLNISKDATISSIIPVINEQLGFPQSTELECFHVPLNKKLQKLNPDSTIQFILNEYGIGNGSILIFQLKQESIDKIPEGSLKLNFEFQSQTANQIEEKLNSSLKLYSESDFNDAKNPLASIENYLSECTIAEIYNYNNQTVPLFNIKFSPGIKVSILKKYIIQAAILNKNIIKSDENDKVVLFELLVDEIFEYQNHEKLSIYYDRLTIYFSISSFDCKQKEITVQFSPDAKTVVIEKIIQLKDCRTFDDIFNNFKSSFSKDQKELKELFNEENNFRFLLIQNGKIEKIITHYDYLGYLKIGDIMRIEVIPRFQIDVKEFSYLLRCFYLNVDFSPSLSFGQPFLLLIKGDEKFSEVKKRLVDYMNLPKDKSMNDFNFYLIFINKKFLEFAVGSNSTKKKSIKEYAVLEKDGSEIIELDDSSIVSDFMRQGSFMLQFAVVSAEIDKIKSEIKDDSKIIKISVKTSTYEDAPNKEIKSSNHHNDLKIYN